jgi:hypothetical protein
MAGDPGNRYCYDQVRVRQRDGLQIVGREKNGLLQHMRVDGSLAELRISMGALKSTNSVSPETKTC